MKVTLFFVWILFNTSRGTILRRPNDQRAGESLSGRSEAIGGAASSYWANQASSEYSGIQPTYSGEFGATSQKLIPSRVVIGTGSSSGYGGVLSGQYGGGFEGPLQESVRPNIALNVDGSLLYERRPSKQYPVSGYEDRANSNIVVSSGNLPVNRPMDSDWTGYRPSENTFKVSNGNKQDFVQPVLIEKIIRKPQGPFPPVFYEPSNGKYDAFKSTSGLTGDVAGIQFNGAPGYVLGSTVGGLTGDVVPTPYNGASGYVLGGTVRGSGSSVSAGYGAYKANHVEGALQPAPLGVNLGADNGYGTSFYRARRGPSYEKEDLDDGKFGSV